MTTDTPAKIDWTKPLQFDLSGVAGNPNWAECTKVGTTTNGRHVVELPSGAIYALDDEGKLQYGRVAFVRNKPEEKQPRKLTTVTFKLEDQGAFGAVVCFGPKVPFKVGGEYKGKKIVHVAEFETLA